MSSFLSGVANSVSGSASTISRGVAGAASTIGKSAADAGSDVLQMGSSAQASEHLSSINKDSAGHARDRSSPASENTSDSSSTALQNVGSLGSTVGEGISAAGDTTWKAGSDFVGAGFPSGRELAASLPKDAFDLQRNVGAGLGSLGGTAIDGVVTAVSATTNLAFDPVGNSLKSIEGLKGLGEGLDTINGLSTTALQSLADATKRAISLAGRPPTLFDPDADGIVNLADTQRGFILLGLKETYAKIIAYAMHSTFTYSTGDAWLTIPNISTLPVKVDNIAKTRWGRNWGKYDRVDWVSDIGVETFFGLRQRQSWTEYWDDTKAYFGTALLIYEWGTTWPLAIPSLSEMEPTSPAIAQLSTIMRTVIIPTISKSREHARQTTDGGRG